MAEGAGWFADPSGKISTYRWWDGQAWTRWLSADPGAPDPGPVPAARTTATATATVDFPPPDPSTGPGPMVTEPVQPQSDPATGARPMLAEPAEASFAPPDPADRVVRLPAAAAVVVGGVLLAVIAVGAIISLTTDRPLTGPAVAPPTPTETPLAVTYDPTTRRLSAQELQVTMPGKPFSCDLEPRTQPGVFTSTFACTAWVHFDYNDDHDDWTAVIGLGVLEERLRTGKDLDAMAEATFTALAASHYRHAKVTISKQRTEPVTGVAPAGKAVLTSAEMHVADDEDLATAYDRMVVAVFELESGRHAAYYLIRPNDSKSDVANALVESAGTVSARK